MPRRLSTTELGRFIRSNDSGLAQLRRNRNNSHRPRIRCKLLIIKILISSSALLFLTSAATLELRLPFPCIHPPSTFYSGSRIPAVSCVTGLRPEEVFISKRTQESSRPKALSPTPEISYAPRKTLGGTHQNQNPCRFRPFPKAHRSSTELVPLPRLRGEPRQNSNQAAARRAPPL